MVENADRDNHYHFLAVILTKRTIALTEKFQKIRENPLDNPQERKQQYQNLFLVSLELDGNKAPQISTSTIKKRELRHIIIFIVRPFRLPAPCNASLVGLTTAPNARFV